MLYSMAEGIFEKPATEGVRLIERLSTEFEVFLMMLSATLAADVSLYFYKKQNILAFNWRFGGEINIGAILIFLLLFSLMTTFISALIIWSLKFAWLVLLSLLPYKLTSLIDGNKNFDYEEHGYATEYKLERYALSEKDTFLMDLVRRHRERVGNIQTHTLRIAKLAVSVIVLVGLDWWISQADRGTFVQIVWGYVGTNKLATLILWLFGLFLVWAVTAELAHDHGERWVLYPPGAVTDADKAKAASQRG